MGLEVLSPYPRPDDVRGQTSLNLLLLRLPGTGCPRKYDRTETDTS